MALTLRKIKLYTAIGGCGGTSALTGLVIIILVGFKKISISATLPGCLLVLGIGTLFFSLHCLLREK